MPPEIVQYADIQTVPEYVNRVAQAIEPQEVPFARSVDSPFSIPEMVSYLDATWVARFKRPLFLNVDPAGVTSLVYDVQTPDEFNVRCSALADVLSRLDVPPDDTLQRKAVRPVVLLGHWLVKRLDEGPAARAEEAAATLSKAVNIRVGGQHANERHKAVDAFQAFGMDYPPANWSVAWATIRQSVVNALDAIRQEVAANLTEGDL